MENQEIAPVPAPAQMFNVNPETKQQADDFINTINSMFETIEMLAGADRPMNEGEWLILAKQFQKLHHAKTRTETTYIYVEAQRTHTRGRVFERKPLTKEEKLKNDNYMMCPNCKKVMTKRHYSEKHTKTGICNHIKAVSDVVSHNTSVKKTDVLRVKINDNDMTYPEISLKYTYKRGAVSGLEFKTTEAKQYSIATRSMMLAEVFKPIQNNATSLVSCINGIVSIMGQILIERDIALNIREHYEDKIITYQNFIPSELEKVWKKDQKSGKWKSKITSIIAKPKKKVKLTLIEDSDTKEEHQQTTRC
jgi:hypothetical protein